MHKTKDARLATGVRIAILAPAVVLLVGALVTLFVVAVVPWWNAQHPPARLPPNELAQEYLDSIASGDAVTAHQLDGRVLKTYPLADTGHELMTNEYLGSAVERISAVHVTLTKASQTRASYEAEFDLQGRTYSVPLDFAWDDESERWFVEQSFAAPITVGAGHDPSELNAVPFTVGGGREMSQDDDESTRLGYAAYPGVYEVTADIDPATVVDAESNQVVREVAVLPVDVGEPAEVVFELRD